MTNARVTIGPPGTGKTTRLLDLLAGELRSGTPPERIAFVTFTRAAREEALARIERDLGLTQDDMPWVRTIHSTAYRLLDLSPEQVMHDGRWKEFSDRYHYDLSDLCESEEGPWSEPPRRTDADVWRYLLMWGQNRRLPLDRALSRFGRWVSAPQVEVFAKRARDFKTEHHLLDFADMLSRALIDGIRPDVDVAFIDEAQDLSPLQIATVEMWFAGCARVFIAGDDDQAIYRFQGAEPDWLITLTRDCPTEILEQSHRVPRVIHAVAQKVIRQNTRRVAKAYEPVAEEGEVCSLPVHDAIKGIDLATGTFILARNRIFLAPVARELYDKRIPYFVEGPGGVNPYAGKNHFEAVNAAVALSRGQAIPAESLRAVLSFIPSRGVDLLPHGVKAKVDAASGIVPPHVLRETYGLGAVLDRMAAEGPTAVLLKMRAGDREYFAGVIRRFGEVPTPKLRLTSIHGAKGREADHVVVLPDMTRSTADEYRDRSRGGHEAENRVAYVAVTRTRKRLTLVRAKGGRAFLYPAPRRERVVSGA